MTVHHAYRRDSLGVALVKTLLNAKETNARNVKINNTQNLTKSMIYDKAQQENSSNSSNFITSNVAQIYRIAVEYLHLN